MFLLVLEVSFCTVFFTSFDVLVADDGFEKEFLGEKPEKFGTVGKSRLMEVCQKVTNMAPTPPQKTNNSPSGNLMDSKLKNLILTR